MATGQRLAQAARSLGERAVRAEPLAYALVAGACTLWVACFFYSSLRLQTLYSRVLADPGALSLGPKLLGDWSAPLDDVFIHFDFARATARGHPFQWSEGNGYSSGGTSLLYPFVLAFGYWIGFRNLDLMLWAGIVACVSVFGLLLASRRLFSRLPRWTSYLAPPALLSVGALDWTLFSGMEVALFLALWGGALIAWHDILEQPADQRPARLRLRAGLLGAWGAALVLTRPEAATTVLALAIGAALGIAKSSGRRRGLEVLIGAATPAVLTLTLHQAANLLLTGDASAAGAVTKLELHHPYLQTHEVFGAWLYHVKYQVTRLTNYHLTDTSPYGWIPWLLAAIALIPATTRRYALLLWASLISWILVIALNGQVAWQNQRYAMPALAWLLLAAALGLGVLIGHVNAFGRRGVWVTAASRAAALGLIFAFVWHAKHRFFEQVWFFGRASRNILDQHVRAGKLLRHQLRPQARRVLVGDAGAIPYASDLPALDIIGLGGHRGLPFARATRLGIGASIELIERLPASERPDVMAIYPHWWDALPLWFGKPLPNGSVTVRGNVICAGASKVLYRADWSALSQSGEPIDLEPGDKVVDELDIADIVSEKAHGYALSRRATGHVQMKMFVHPRHAGRALWDAGRAVPPDVVESFTLAGFSPGRPARLVFRVAPPQTLSFAVVVDGERIGEIRAAPADTWVEQGVSVPVDRVRNKLLIRIEPLKNERILYHLWAIQKR